MIIHVSNRQKSLKFLSKHVKPIVKHVIQEEGQHCQEVSIYFVDTEEICRLHDEFFNDPSTTDCISFPMDGEEEEYRVLGEVFVCPETALQYAQSNKLDPYEETTLYLIHGLLHLMGYDDIEEEDIQRMRTAEAHHLSRLKTLNLILKPLT